MRKTLHAGILAAALPLLLCACNKTVPDRPKDTTTKDRQEVEEIDLSVRLRVAEARIAKLERRVFELQAAPGTVEADLLRQRLTVTEAALADATRASADVPMPVPAPTPPGPRPGRKSTARTEPTSPAAPPLSRSNVKSPTVAPRLKLVDPKTFEMTR